MEEHNERTLDSYENTWEEYAERAGSKGAAEAWLKRAVRGLEKTAKIFEFGSGPGQDALYLRSLGYEVICSDASPKFVELMRKQNLQARLLDVLKDPLPDACQLIMANSVMHHFTREQAGLIVGKIFSALAPGGRFVFITAEGSGETWRGHRPEHPVYFYLWQKPELESLLSDAGFETIEIEKFFSRALFSKGSLPWLRAEVRKAGP